MRTTLVKCINFKLKKSELWLIEINLNVHHKTLSQIRFGHDKRTQ